MLVSVVINNYNYGRFLAEAIESVLAQSHPEMELIVVDDGSKDNSREIIAQYEGRLTAVLKPNGGQGSALNAGFAASTGDLVLFLDADDYLYPHAIQRIVKAWETPFAKLHFPLTRINDAGREIGTEPRRGLRLPQGKVWPDFIHEGRYITPATSGSAYARNVLAAVLPMPEVPYIYAADAYLNNRVVFHGLLGVIREPLGVYRVHGTNDSLGNVLSADVERVRYLMAREIHNDAAFQQELQRLGVPADPESRYRYYQRQKLRTLSWKLDRAEHPKRGDHFFKLVAMAFTAVWRSEKMPLRERLLQTLWFLFVFTAPSRAVIFALSHGGGLKRMLKPTPTKTRRPLAGLPANA